MGRTAAKDFSTSGSLLAPESAADAVKQFFPPGDRKMLGYPKLGWYSWIRDQTAFRDLCPSEKAVAGRSFVINKYWQKAQLLNRSFRAAGKLVFFDSVDTNSNIPVVFNSTSLLYLPR
ncbi:hypothetical protein TWF106_002072 [Orbilia oligospora]|uniref:Uncharacterized protein n=1 Tax=Orbilia oligospora TaxID=2813651 RepID=A0A6G1MM94_ORBOL|nr:hypothetical protein TWF106_002072 [Orbilia oligospora]KAF3213325.1 hypothetical protein TWF191_010086 [Orbilia oligospora]KAF3262549.1 hypothetical protein TWF192_007220 [Orbilia oligospora]